MTNAGVVSDETRQTNAPRAGKGGIVPPVEYRWKPGTTPNPGGSPKGFIPLSKAYRIVADMPFEDIQKLRRGERPACWQKSRRVLIPYVVAAGQYLAAAAGQTSAAAEIADRTEGKVTQKTENVTAGLEDAIREVHARILARREKPD